MNENRVAALPPWLGFLPFVLSRLTAAESRADGQKLPVESVGSDVEAGKKGNDPT